MMRKQKEHDLEVRAEINVTSLVDVAFTLLIIFIITAPILQGGIDVDLPQGEISTLQADPDQLIVSVLADGSIALGESMVDRQAFQSSFEQLIAVTQPTRILIKSDSAATYAAWFQVASIIKDSGIPMGLIGQELPRR